MKIRGLLRKLRRRSKDGVKEQDRLLLEILDSYPPGKRFYLYKLKEIYRVAAKKAGCRPYPSSLRDYQTLAALVAANRDYRLEGGPAVKGYSGVWKALPAEVRNEELYGAIEQDLVEIKKKLSENDDVFRALTDALDKTRRALELHDSILVSMSKYLDETKLGGAP